MEDNTRDVFGGEYLLESMRHSGYETVYALAEIIDNSIDAKAKNVEVLCVETDSVAQQHVTRSLNTIVIVDDGDGMSEEKLWDSLRMGVGTRRSHGRKGILGKFGMGLPNASMSQCNRVEVYSWQKGGDVLYTVLGEECVKDGKVIIRKPTKNPIPEYIRNKSNILNSKSGTVVVWNYLDKVPMKRGKTLIDNCELVIGRIYRWLIHRGDVTIRMLSSYKKETQHEKLILPNDPLYQMLPSSTLAPFDKERLFQPDGDKWVDEVKIGGGVVEVRYAYVTKKGRELDERGRKAGSQPHGKHADSNLGISIVREDRELYLDTNLCQTYDPLERWWGVEVLFKRELDDVFNVTNTKQAAVNFSTMTKRIASKLRVEEEPDDVGPEEKELFVLVRNINSRIRQMRRAIDKLKPKSPSGKNSEPVIPWPDPQPGTPTFLNPSPTPIEKERAITEALSKFNPDGASERAKEILRKNLPVSLERANMGDDTHEFFTVEFPGGVAIITLNIDHPVYTRLLKYTEDTNELTDTPVEQLHKIKASLNSIIYSWARLENTPQTPSERARLRKTRMLWGEQLYDMLNKLYE